MVAQSTLTAISKTACSTALSGAQYHKYSAIVEYYPEKQYYK